MNSFYKKIALVCLVSLTANQGAYAFQFSDIGNWIRANPKKSLAIYVIGLYALITGTSYALRKYGHRTQRNSVPSYRTSSLQYEYTTYVADHAFPSGKLILINSKKFSELEQDDREHLEAMYAGLTESMRAPYRKFHVTVARDKDKKIEGAIFYEPSGKDNSSISIPHWQGTGTLKAGLFKPLIKTGKDIRPKYKEGYIAGYRYHDVSAEIEACDNVKPKRHIRWSEQEGDEEVWFDRSEARAKVQAHSVS